MGGGDIFDAQCENANETVCGSHREMLVVAFQQVLLLLLRMMVETICKDTFWSTQPHTARLILRMVATERGTGMYQNKHMLLTVQPKIQ
jgi:hypothetical protein